MEGNIADKKYIQPKRDDVYEDLHDGHLSKIYFNVYGELSLIIRYPKEKGHKEICIFFDEAAEKMLADFFKKNIKIQLQRPEVFEKRQSESYDFDGSGE